MSQAALDSRSVIGQAQGILMQIYGIDMDQAFEVLRRYNLRKKLGPGLIQTVRGLGYVVPRE